MAEPSKDSLTVVISSTAYDLPDHRREVMDACLELGHQPRMMEHLSAADAGAIAESLALVDTADVYIGIFAHRYGFVPPDCEHSITEMEYRRARDKGVPRLIFFMHKDHPIKAEDVEFGEGAAKLVRLKDEIGVERVAAFFESPDDLRAEVLKALVHQLERRRPARERVPAAEPRARLRGWPALELPEQPYPLLLPYSHPRLFAGRDRELTELRALLRAEIPIVLLHAVSGAGKSSLLRAALAPALDQEDVPVALDDRPAESGLGRRLIAGLLASDEWAPEEGPPFEDDDPETFAGYLRQARQLAGKTPVLLVDQFEEVFQHTEQRGVAGLLLAASLRHQPSVGPPPVRWVLAYRQEFHGDVRTWLGDVLADARRAGARRAGAPDLDRLPHDLAGIRRSVEWALHPFATPRPGEPADAEAAFRAAVETPLAVLGDDGRPRYALRFASDGAERLAAAFAESRSLSPEAPLVPELQVVLAKLLRDGRDGEVQVGADPGQLISDALEEHLRLALDRVFPPTLTQSHRVARSRALLALRELADAAGRRGTSLPAAELARAFVPENEPDPAAGERLLERLAAADTRLLIRRLEDGAPHYALSHDRMAEVVVRTVDQEGRRGALEVDPELLGLRRYVGIMTRLFRAGELPQATGLPAERFEAIRVHAEALLWDQDRRRWWRACKRRQREQRDAFVEQLSSASASKVLEALAALAPTSPEREEMHQHIASRTDWRHAFGEGPAGLAEHEREAVVLAAAEAAAACIEDGAGDLDAFGAAAWAIDHFAGRSRVREVHERALAVRGALLEPLRQRQPPPEAAELPWAAIAAGSFAMGSEGDKPGHQVTVSPFRMLAHPLTNALYRRLVPEHPGDDDLPLVSVSWFRAYAFAAWLGGRLPTEAEWEYAARGGCPHAYSDRHGNETTLDKVGWYSKNSGGKLQAVMQLEPNSWGLYDVYGNAWEWVADWYAEYSEESQVDPWGPASGLNRVLRGGSFEDSAEFARAANRVRLDPENRYEDIGFRVVLPGPPSRSSGDLGS